MFFIDYFIAANETAAWGRSVSLVQCSAAEEAEKETGRQQYKRDSLYIKGVRL